MRRAIRGKIGCVVLCAALLSGMLQPVAEVTAKKSVRLSANSLSLTVGKVKTVKVKGARKVTWSVSGKAVKVMKKGRKSIRLKGLQLGKATITAKVKSKKVSCKVIVTEEKSTVKPSPVYSEDQLNQISMRVQEYRPDTNTVTIDIYNNTSSMVVYGRMFQLERFENTVWKTVPFVGNIAFPCDAVMLPSGGKTSETIALDACFGTLSAGKYRIVKTVFCDALSKDGIVLSVEFDITGNGTPQASPTAEPGKTVPPQETVLPPQETVIPPRQTATPPQKTTAPPQETVNPPQEIVTPSPQIPLRRDTEDGEIIDYVNIYTYSMMQSPPEGMDSRIISDTQGLQELEEVWEKRATNCINDPVNFLLNQLADYDEEYFRENNLAFGIYELTYGYSVLPQLAVADGKQITCQLQEKWDVANDMAVPCVMISHIVLIELPKGEVGECTEFVLEPSYDNPS